MSMKQIDMMTFTAALVKEGSWGASALGTHESTMALYLSDDDKTGLIEWDIPSLDEVEQIGLWFEWGKGGRRYLIDYDGVASLPREAIALLRRNGIQVGEDFE